MTDLQIQTNYYEKTEIEKITEILKQLNLKETTESAESMLKLIDFFCELNKVEKPTLDLDSINSFMQKNFFTKIPILGIVPIMNKEKIKIIEQHRNEIERCFETIGFYNQPKVNRKDINDIVNILRESGNNRLIVRIMGNNELILEQQFKRVREILEQIPEEVRGQVNVKLLGKTNINMFFGEDRESEILIMKRLAKLWLEDLGYRTDAVATFGEANTINTIVKEENSRTTVNGESIVIDILCPNGAERQMEDIELYKSKKKKRILEKILKIGDELEKTNNEFKRKELRQEIDNLNNELLEKENERHYFDGCGGIKQLRDVLNNNIEGVGCDEHQLCYQYYYNKELNKFNKWIVEK